MGIVEFHAFICHHIYFRSATGANRPKLQRSRSARVALIDFANFIENKRLIKPLLVVRVGPGTNPKYGSHWTESLIAT